MELSKYQIFLFFPCFIKSIFIRFPVKDFIHSYQNIYIETSTKLIEFDSALNVLNLVLESPHKRQQKLLNILRFHSSTQEATDLIGFIIMKPLPKHIFWIAATSRNEIEKYPNVQVFSERGYEAILLNLFC